MNNSITIPALLTAILMFGVMLFLSANQRPTEAASVTQFLNLGVATTSVTNTVTVSERILATTTSVTGTSYMRVYASICNVGPSIAYIRMDSDKPTNILTAGATSIAVGACYEITDRNGYSGSVTASSTGEVATTLLVTEYVY